MMGKNIRHFSFLSGSLNSFCSLAVLLGDLSLVPQCAFIIQYCLGRLHILHDIFKQAPESVQSPWTSPLPRGPEN